MKETVGFNAFSVGNELGILYIIFLWLYFVYLPILPLKWNLVIIYPYRVPEILVSFMEFYGYVWNWLDAGSLFQE